MFSCFVCLRPRFPVHKCSHFLSCLVVSFFLFFNYGFIRFVTSSLLLFSLLNMIPRYLVFCIPIICSFYFRPALFVISSPCNWEHSCLQQPLLDRRQNITLFLTHCPPHCFAKIHNIKKIKVRKGLEEKDKPITITGNYTVFLKCLEPIFQNVTVLKTFLIINYIKIIYYLRYRIMYTGNGVPSADFC